MKHLRKFNTQADYDAYTEQGIDYPCVSVVVDSGDMKYDGDDPFWVQPYEDNEYYWDVETEYSFNTVTWETLPEYETLLIPAYRKVYWRRAEAEHSGCLMTEELDIACNVGGDIMSLFHGSYYRENKTLPEGSCCMSLFEFSGVKDASKLILSAEDLTEYCYEGMFCFCNNIEVPPRLPAMKLAKGCYYFMFEESNLKYAPKLPSTNLAEDCYCGMFFICENLTSAPELPATTLAKNCYDSMFFCSGITKAPCLPATILEEGCYAAMFVGCEDLAVAPELPATELSEYCYQQMFYECHSLEVAPTLPALYLKRSCYEEMFYNCKSLHTIKMMAISSATWAFSDWVEFVPEGGTFIQNAQADWEGYGVIPEGWTIEYAES